MALVEIRGNFKAMVISTSHKNANNLYTLYLKNGKLSYSKVCFVPAFKIINRHQLLLKETNHFVHQDDMETCDRE